MSGLNESNVRRSKKIIWVVGLSILIPIAIMAIWYGFAQSTFGAPDAPEVGNGKVIVYFYDPVSDEYIDGTFDLVKVSNHSEFYQRGVATGEVVDITLEDGCYMYFNGSSVDESYGYDYYGVSSAVEASGNSNTPVNNTVFLSRRAYNAEVDLDIIAINSSTSWSYGAYDESDLSGTTDLLVLFQLSCANTSNFVGKTFWVPNATCDEDALDLGWNGQTLFLALIGDGMDAPLNDSYVGVTNIDDKSIIRVNPFVAGYDSGGNLITSYQFQLPYFGEIDILEEIRLYDGYITDWDTSENIFETIDVV